MESHPDRRSFTGLLVGLLLLPAGGAAAAFLWSVNCPNCTGMAAFKIPESCFRCKNRRTISLIDRWRRGGPEAVEGEGLVVSTISLGGFGVTKKKRALALLNIRPGDILTVTKMNAAVQALMETNDYIQVQVYGQEDPASRDRVILHLFVVEKSTNRLDLGDPDD